MTDQLLQKRLSDTTILMVEDNPITLNVQVELFRRLGVDVITAGNGLEALEVLRNSPAKIDIVLTDVSMPEMDGLELTRQIRSDAKYSRLPIFGLSIHDLASDIEKAREAGMNDYIPKPFSVNDTVEKILRVLKAKTLDPMVMSLTDDYITIE